MRQTGFQEISRQALEKITQVWERYAEIILLLGCFLLPLKLALTYVCFGPAIFGCLVKNRSDLKHRIREHSWFFIPWGIFVLSLVIHAFFGFYPWRSLQSLYALVFYPVLIVAVAESFPGQRALLPLLALVLGQALAGMHSVLDTASAATLPRLFLGAVTESGQLALVAPLACGLAVTLHRFSKVKLSISSLIKRTGSTAGLSALLCIAAFGNQLFSISSNILLPIVSLLLLAVFCLNYSKQISIDLLSGDRFSSFCRFSCRFLESLFLPVLFAALVVNLKRGPWAGVLVAFAVFFLIYSRKLVIPLLIAITTIIAVTPPVQTRLLQSSKDFFIPGGRSAIWQVGVQIAERFPLGIGFRNSKFLHSYSVEIPAELTHFHNNAINILVESGPLTLILFATWVFSIIRFAFMAKVSPALAPTAKAVGCALVAWQVAGIVEYNFGDSEVVFVVYVLLGALAGMQKMASVSDFNRAVQ